MINERHLLEPDTCFFRKVMDYVARPPFNPLFSKNRIFHNRVLLYINDLMIVIATHAK